MNRQGAVCYMSVVEDRSKLTIHFASPQELATEGKVRYSSA